MKAIVYETYGPPGTLRVKEVADPVLTHHKLLVRVVAAAVNPYDWHYMRGRPFILRLSSGLFKPKRTILGVDFAGIVEAAGPGVTRFKPGDAVFGLTPEAFAEYVAANENQIALKPPSISFEQAAGTPASAYTALQCLRDYGHIQAGHRVLINGASGGVGTFAVQIAKTFAASVTGVCSTRNVELVRRLGADHVIDYTQEDFTQDTERYDLVLDAVGNHNIAKFKRLLSPNGIYVAAAGPWTRLVWIRLTGRKNVVTMMGKPNPDDLETIRSMMAAGQIKTVIDRTYPFAETPDAIAYLEEGHARGKVIISVSGSLA